MAIGLTQSSPDSPDNKAIREIAKNTGKPEWKTWVFWLVVVGVILQVVEMLR